MKGKVKSGAIRIAVVYAAIAGAWILLSDRALRLLTTNIEVLVTWSTYKGWFFVLVTASLLFLERRRAEKAFRRSEMRFQRAVESFPDGFVIYDAERRFQFANGKGLVLSGSHQDQILGRRDEDIFPREIVEIYLPSLVKAQETRQTQVLECVLPMPAGSRMYHLTYVPLVEEGDKTFQILGIVRDITDQKLFEDQLKDSLQERETLLSEVHHRVKNNLQVVSSLLNLQAGKIRITEAVEALRESQNRIKSMALIHEKLYQTGTLSRIDIGEYIRDLAVRLSHSYAVARVGMEFDLATAYLTVDKAIPCGLILNELVSNALKHAFPAGKEGTVFIQLRSLGDATFVLGVRDNGIGLPDDLDFSRSPSLGMQLVQTLSSQLDGRVTLDRDGGTTVSVTFKA